MGTTEYGFTWGQLEVIRLFERNGRRVVTLQTEHRTVQLYVSPTGRRVRVYIDGQEATPDA